jgi:hypothetical protein
VGAGLLIKADDIRRAMIEKNSNGRFIMQELNVNRSYFVFSVDKNSL